MPLAGIFRSEKTPQQVVQNLKEALTLLDKEQANPKKLEKINEDVSKYLQLTKQILMGTPDQEPQTELVVQLSAEVYNRNVIQLLIQSLPLLDFEGKKYASQILSNLLKRQIGARYPTVDYIATKPEVLSALVSGYDLAEIALHSGIVLRECTKHESLARLVLLSDQFYQFFQYVEVPTFDIASDAFVSFRELLTIHKPLASEFLEQNYDKFFGEYKKLLLSENYVTKRQSLKLLGELLLDRHNYNVMQKYISNADNLKMMMNMLRDNSRSIQFEAFHVFKIFVANPNKSKEVMNILLKNKNQLIDFLSKFQADRREDDQFNDEKEFLIKQVRALQAPTEPAPSTS